ncbi:hypothetical protein GUITHDRAFT_90664, partial [Guillardia theta CCMP2712]
MQYYPHDTYLMALDAAHAEAVHSLRGVEGVFAMPAEAKTASRAAQVRAAAGATATLDVQVAVTNETRGTFASTLMSWQRDLRKVVPPSSFTMRWASTSKVVVVVDVAQEDAVWAWLAEQPLVVCIEERPTFIINNKYASMAVQSNDGTQNKLWSQGLLGSGEIVGCADTGVDYDSCFFQDPNQQVKTCQGLGAPANCVNMNHRKIVSYRYFASTNVGDTSYGHGTHVVGSILGNSLSSDYTVSYNGGAPEAKLSFDDISSDGSSLWLPDDLNTDLFPHAFAVGANLHSNSWGSSTSAYTSTAQEMDQFIFDHDDFLILVAAGNSGPGAGTIGSPATAKNILAVGAGANTLAAYQDYDGYTGTAHDKQRTGLVDFSSRGPTPDGRFKPDIVCPGESIRSAYSDGTLTSFQCSIAEMSGTSMATPTCAGASALVRQYFREGFLSSGARNASAAMAPSASLVKAIMIHAGQPMWYTESSTWRLPPSLPHVSQGFGRVDLESVLYFGPSTPFKLKVHDREVVEDQQTRHFCFLAPSRPSSLVFRASLVWTDPPAPVGSQRTLMHDLNLMVQ